MLKDIRGYEGLYAVTDDGQVWSHRKKRFLQSFDNGLGYLKVNLYKNGYSKNARIHRLVLETFNPVEGMEKLQVNHIDENKTNNNLLNLEWVTPSENVRHSIHKKIGKSREIRPVAQYSLEGELIAIYPTQVEAARASGVSKYSISDMLRGRTHSAGGYIWRFANGKEE